MTVKLSPAAERLLERLGMEPNAGRLPLQGREHATAEVLHRHGRAYYDRHGRELFALDHEWVKTKFRMIRRQEAIEALLAERDMKPVACYIDGSISLTLDDLTRLLTEQNDV